MDKRGFEERTRILVDHQTKQPRSIQLSMHSAVRRKEFFNFDFHFFGPRLNRLSYKGKSLLALAIYLHALADSYSRESCMAVEQFRGHKPRPVDCNAVFWHVQNERKSNENQIWA